MSAIITTNSRVKVRMNGNDRELHIVDSQYTNPQDGMISSESPIAQALIGAHAGKSVVALLPQGRRLDVEILEVR